MSLHMRRAASRDARRHSYGQSAPEARSPEVSFRRPNTSLDSIGEGHDKESSASKLLACDPRTCPLSLAYKSWDAYRRSSVTDGSSIPEASFEAPISPSIYTALSPWQTRLVEVRRRSSGARELEVRVFPVDFVDMEGVGVTGTSQVVRYTALSHVWGKKNSEHPLITCNGQLTAISKQLYDALIHLATKTTETLIWVDNLSINQNDPVEKARQVRNMLRIFEKADKVIAWLQTDAIVRAEHMLTQEQSLDLEHGDDCIRGWICIANAQQALVTDSLWSRTWCRQEIFAAKELFLMGRHIETVSMDVFLSSLKQVDLVRKKIAKSEVPVWNENIRLVHEVLEKVVSPSFAAMVKMYRHAGTDDYTYQAPTQKRRYTYHWLHTLRAGTIYQVTDERDRIYANLGMVASPSTRSYVEHRPNIDPADLPIDYSKSVSEVYQDLTKYLINTDRNLDCLVVFENRDARYRSNDLPSWVTNWRHARPRSLPCMPPDRTRDVETSDNPPIQDFADIGKLRLEGKVLFTVRQLSSYELPDFRKHPAPRLAGSDVFGPVASLDTHEALGEIQKFYVLCTNRVDIPLTQVLHGAIEVWVPHTTRLGDVLVLLKGSSFPFVLHESNPGQYQLIGPVLYHRCRLPAPIAALRKGTAWIEEVFLRDQDASHSLADRPWQHFVVV
jgi:hypothetical protein